MMVFSPRLLAAVATVATTLAALGPAVAQTKLCVSSAFGVPGLSGKPEPWWTGTFDIDDPRWTGASGNSLGSVGASHSPVEVRTTWANEGGRDYLYVSWLVYVDTANPLSGKHWLYLAFMPPGATIDDPATRLVRVRFSGAATGAPTYCNDEPTCSDPAIYQVFERELPDPPDPPVNAPCGTIVSGPKFQLVPEATAALPWLTDTLRFKDEGTRWAVQVRIPVDPMAANLAAGVREDTAIAYQSGLELASSLVAFHRWPRSTTAPTHELVCDLTGPDAVVLDPDASWRGLSLTGGTLPDPPAAECGNRLRIDSGDIGVRAGAAGTALSPTFALTGANTVVARVHNTSGVDIAATALSARFRIADWGSQVGVGGSWGPLPVLLPTANPTAETHNSANLVAGTDQDLELAWTLTDDQRCQYTFDQRTQAVWSDPTGANCEVCATTVGSSGDGARRRGSTACLPGRTRHQCMQVELSGGDVDFEQRSSYNNMDFAELSVFERKASIDTAGLPVEKDQKRHEIYLVVMPRNMPGAVQAQTYEQLIAANAQRLLAALAAPTNDAPPPPDAPPPLPLGDRPLVRPLPGNIELPAPDEQVLLRYPRTVRPIARELSRLALLDERHAGVKAATLVQALAASFDARTLGELVPTLDVYVYYRTGPKSRGLAPMTAFSLVTSHDGPVEGLRWALDGATRVGGNVYKLVIPVGGSREIGVRVQALEPGETPIVERPAGCCRQGGGTTTASLAGTSALGLATILTVGRRRRRRAKPTA